MRLCFLIVFLFSKISLGAPTITGDLRYRHEIESLEGTEDRTRHRMRLRVGIDTTINEKTNVGLRMATAERLSNGSVATASTNETLDNAGSKKEIHVDMAYIQHAITPQLTATLGKMENALFIPGKSDLIWDADWTPEGIGFNYSQKPADLYWFLRGVGYWLDERATETDSGLLGFQIGSVAKISNQEIIFGIGRLQATSLKDHPFLVNAADAKGNSANGTNYAYNYEMNELFIELPTLIGSHSTIFYFNYVTNESAEDGGYLLGVLIGKLKNTGDFLVNYNYRRVEKDAVIGALTDGDFIGGGTNGKGHKLSVSYLAATNTTLSLSHFLNLRDLDVETDYQRTQLDFNFKF